MRAPVEGKPCQVSSHGRRHDFRNVEKEQSADRPHRLLLDVRDVGFGRFEVSSHLSMFVVGLIPFLVAGTLTFANTSDDPLITLRYASNLLHHGQPVSNLGERVEGYTSPLHLLVAAGVLLLPGGLALFKLKLVSVMFAAGALWQTSRLSRAVGLPHWAQLGMLVAVAGSWDFMLSASNGLETSLVAFLATGTTASLARADRWWRTAIWASLLVVSRPDAVLVVAVLAILSLARERSLPWWRRIYWLCGPAVTLGALLVFRVAYYGVLVPNTYFAKQLGVVRSALLGLGYLVNSQPLSGVGLGLILLPLQAWLIWVGGRRFLRSRPAMAYPMAVLVAQVLFIFASGGDWMKGGRFLAPAIPAAAVLTFAGLEAVLESPGSNRTISATRRGLTVMAVVAVLILPVDGTYFAPAWGLTRGVGDRTLIAGGNYPLSPIWVTAVRLADCLKPGQSVAYSEAGLFGYEHPALRLIDTRGLTSPEIARDAPAADRHPWGVQDPRWFLQDSTVGRVLTSRRPDMIISFDVSADDWPSSAVLGGLYRRAAIIPEPSSDHTLLVYVRRDLACAGLPTTYGHQSRPT